MLYTSFIAAKSAISAIKTLTLTTFSMVVPEAVRTAVRFLMHWCWVFPSVEDCDNVKEWKAYSSSLDISLHEFASLRIESDLAGAVNGAVGDNGLVIDAGQRLRGVWGEDGLFLCRHFGNNSVMRRLGREVRLGKK